MSLPELRRTTVEVTGVTVRFGESFAAPALRDVSLRLSPGQVHAVIGASGSGKSTLLNALAGNLGTGARAAGTVMLRPADGGSPNEVPMGGARFDALPPTSPLAGRAIAVVPQSAATALTPVRTVGSQLAEACRALRAPQRPADLLRAVGLSPDVLSLYPHELSGGMAQRVTAAFAFAGNAPVVLADEPTSALDPESTAGMLSVLRDHADRGGTVVLVTHDVEALEHADVSDVVTVLDGGRIVESDEACRVLAAPRDARTKRLLAALPSRNGARTRTSPAARGGRSPQEAVLSVQDATVSVQTAGGARRSLLRGVDLRLRAGELVGLVGPSGSGKSTLVRVMSGLQEPDAGAVLLGTTPVRDVRGRAGRVARGRIGVVFQSARAAMDPRLTLDRAIALALREAERRAARRGGGSERSAERAQATKDFASAIGLTSDLLARRPHEVSDGQLQRAALVRVAAQQPEAVLCDEITAALDPVAAAAVMAALRQLSELTGAAVLVVSHDAALLAATVDRTEPVAQWADDGSVYSAPRA